MKICKDGRVWGQNNKEAGTHLGISTNPSKKVRKLTDEENRARWKNYGKDFEKGHIPWNKGKKRPHDYTSITGKNHYLWKGGITDLQQMIHNSDKYKEWRNAVFFRDGYSCICGVVRTNIHVHHILAFSIILGEFLKKYSVFSPFEDKETLLRLSETHDDFWDVNNGTTL
jgi:hypothetical protein